MFCSGQYILGACNLELERKKELDRRKKLRLLQVRQQSKEFADKLRERIKGEIVKQKTRYVEAENKLKQEQHLKELCQLKEFYDKCIESVGSGHKEAAKQPDINLEKENELNRISQQAAKRGSRALREKLENEAVLKQKRDAPVKQKKSVRNKENLRALFISSLPQHNENCLVYTNHPSKEPHQNIELKQKRRVLEEVPSNVNVKCSTVRDINNHTNLENIYKPLADKSESKGKENIKEDPETGAPVTKLSDPVPITSSPRECSCDYIVCFCHKSPAELRRCSSESKLSSDKAFDFDKPVKKKVRRRSCSPRSVRTLNYFQCGNVYESNQQSTVRVTHHSRSPERTEEGPKSNTVDEYPVAKQLTEELKKRVDERSAKALKKEQLKKDFQQLIQNLKKLSLEKSLISRNTKGKLGVFASERDILLKNDKKQKKLNNAFEKIPHSLKNKVQNTGADQDKQIRTFEDSSPPTLNLAVCQANMPSPFCPRRVVSDINICENTPKYGGRRGRSESPNIDVRTDQSGDVHITVKVSEMLGQGQSPRKTRSPPPASESSYLSPPSNLTPSQQHLLDALLKQVDKRAISREMRKYIEKLLKMNRDSIDNLHPQPTRAKAGVQEDLVRLSELAETYYEKVNELVDMYEQLHSTGSSPGGYVDPIRGPQGGSAPRNTPGITPMDRSSPSMQPRAMNLPCRPGRSTTPSPGIRESPEATYVSSSPGDDTLDLAFGGVPGVKVPTKRQLDELPSYSDSTRSDLPEDVNMKDYFTKKRQYIVGESPVQDRLLDNCSSCSSSVSQESDIASRVEELKQLKAGIDTILQGGVLADDQTICSAELLLPLPTNDLDCSFKTLHLQEPTLSGSVQVDFLDKHLMLNNDEIVLDSTFDSSAFQFPLNLEKLDVLRQKLVETCKGQLCNVPCGDVEMPLRYTQKTL